MNGMPIDKFTFQEGRNNGKKKNYNDKKLLVFISMCPIDSKDIFPLEKLN
jgi:hypothetical protein